MLMFDEIMENCPKKINRLHFFINNIDNYPQFVRLADRFCF